MNMQVCVGILNYRRGDRFQARGYKPSGLPLLTRGRAMSTMMLLQSSATGYRKGMRRHGLQLLLGEKISRRPSPDGAWRRVRQAMNEMD